MSTTPRTRSWVVVASLLSRLAMAQPEEAAEMATFDDPSPVPLVTAEPAPAVKAAPGVAQPPPSPPAPARWVRVELKDGQVLHGELTAESGRSLSLAVAGADVTLDRSQVRSLGEETRMTPQESGELWAFDPNRTRYFYTPSAMMLRKGEMNFSQKELFFTSFGVGVTDWLSLQVGSVLPLFLAGVQGSNFIGAVKVGAPVAERVHLAAGVQTLYVPYANLAGGFVFGSATYGTPDAHATVSVGKPFLASSGGSAVGDAIVTVSGNYRVSRGAALVTENWILPNLASGQTSMLNSGGVRLMGEHLSVDLGGIWMSQNLVLVTPMPIPWLDFTYNF